MINDLVKFSGILRENGIPASIRSTQTAYEALKLLQDNGEILKSDYKISNNNEEILKEALSSIYLKNQRQRKKFNELFDSQFKKGETREEANPKGEKEKNSGYGNILKSRKFLRVYSYSIKPPQSNKFNQQHLEEDKIDYTPPLDPYLPQKYEDDLLYRDINQLNSFEGEIFELCQKLGRKIANRRARRLKRSHTMRPDIRRTIRKNLKYGGALIELVKSKPKLKKSEHFFLTDVSGSCDWISNWFFSLVYASGTSFRKARTFDFDNKTIETTLALEEPTPLKAFMEVRDLRVKNLMIHGSSDMFLSFKSFLNQVKLNHKSMVIILSDCRDWAGPKAEGKPRSAETIRIISEKSRKVLILNPEPKNKWNVVDSCVSHYEDAGAKFYQVGNLKQLADFIMEI